MLDFIFLVNGTVPTITKHSVNIGGKEGKKERRERQKTITIRKNGHIAPRYVAKGIAALT